MKKIALLLLILSTSSTLWAQNKEKIKGSKVVTQALHEIEPFENIEVDDNFEIYLIKGSSPTIEIEADDNLHDAISFNVMGNTLRITSQKNVISSKKYAIKIYYSDNLKMVIAKNEAKIYALEELQIDNITIKTQDKAAVFLNVKATDFSLLMNDKSKAEINTNATNTVIEMSKYTELKALISTTEIKIDMYEKSEAQIEGNTTASKIRLDNNANLTSKKFSSKVTEISCEQYAKCNINVSNESTISLSGKSELELYGEPSILLKKFSNNAILYKK
ncbi:MAG: DUF2807 domain-containing protein [Flavobacterium sp.]|jgi:hypothetical protein|nr:DUF2807 domain-containing protein [Flavobacterium sp.]